MSAQPISEARLAANRANAQKSTGPRTPEGKSTVAGNALKHGLRSERNPLELSHDVALPHEQDEFIATLTGFTTSLAPIGPLEIELVERLAQLNLRLNRAVRIETTHLNVQLTSEKTAMTAAGIAAQADNANQNNAVTMLAFLREPNALTLIGRYESRLSRDFARTLTQIHNLQKLRKQTQSPAEATMPTRSLASDERNDGQIACPANEFAAEQTQSPTGTLPTRSRVRKGAGIDDAAQPSNFTGNDAEQTQLVAHSQPSEEPLNHKTRVSEHSNPLPPSMKEAA